jgi:hypothetical protein
MVHAGICAGAFDGSIIEPGIVISGLIIVAKVLFFAFFIFLFSYFSERKHFLQLLYQIFAYK